MKELKGKAAVVTGGASGIGKAIAAALIAQGARVMIADVERERLEATAKAIGARAMAVDVTRAEQVAALAETAKAAFGTVDILCNNAGVGPMAPLKDLTLNDWRWLLDVNLWGVIHGVTAFLPILRANPEGGHIVNTASMASLMPVPGLTAYCTSKYAVIGMSETMAEDIALDGSNIGISILCPGPVSTDLGSSTRNRPAELVGGLADVKLEDSTQFEEQEIDWLSPEATGQLVVDAIRENRRYVITHPGMLPEVERRHRAIEQAFHDEAARRAGAAG